MYCQNDCYSKFSKYGTGVTINPNGAMDDGKFELVILKNLDLVVLGKLFQEIY
jgi:diacylglycerol kinase family enzyme